MPTVTMTVEDQFVRQNLLGASVFKVRDVSRHKSMDLLRAYVRDADLFRDHADAGLV